MITTDHPVSGSEGEEEEEEENEFYDAVGSEGSNSGTALPTEGGDDGGTSNSFTLNIPTGHRRNSSDSSDETDEARETQKVCY